MPERDPAINPVCVRCGSDAMIPDAFLLVSDLGSARHKVGLNTNPDAKIRKAPVHVDVSLRVCGDCGTTELVAEEPHALWEAHMKRLSNEA